MSEKVLQIRDTMIEEESYSALYLYNALIEYVYFLIILIQDKGPNDLNNIAKHVRFFKKDVYSFIQIFNGKNLTEKVGQTLCSTTSVFEIKDNLLHLTNNYAYFKHIIYEDLLVSKVVDLILRGVCRVQDICHNLNFNSLIAIKEDILIAMLEYYPYFHLDSESSVILLRFHGLLGFEKHIYHTTVKYFQSYLQNLNELTYKDIKLHSSCIPSCAAKNSLVIFCILHISPYFKCKNGKISLRNRLKRKVHCEQVIDIEKIESKMSSDSFSIGLLLYKAVGPVISSWTGEVSSLSSCAGLIQSVVNFTNGYQGIFVIYFYKTALKYTCEVGDLRHFLNVCDVLEFDAEFCSETTKGEVLWQATRIKVTKHVLKENKYELNHDTEKYMEDVNLNYHKLKPLLKVCSVNNCLVKYTLLEKENTNNNTFELNSSRFVIERISNNQEPEESQVQNVVLFNANSHANCVDKIELACNHLVISNCDNNTTFTQRKSCISQNISYNILDDSLKVDLKKLPKKCREANALLDVVAVPNKIAISHEVKNVNEFSIIHRKESSEENQLLNIVNVANETVTSLEVKNENESSIIQSKLPKEFPEENELLNAVVRKEVKNENKHSVFLSKFSKEFSEENYGKETTISHDMKNEADYSIIHPKLPKEFSEVNKLLNVVGATNGTIPHEVKYEADYSIILPKLPKEFSEVNKLLNVVGATNGTIPHEVKYEADYSIIHPKLPKEFSEVNKLLNVVGATNGTIPHEVKYEADYSIILPKLAKEFSEEKELLNVVVAPLEKTLSHEVDNEAEYPIIRPKVLNKSLEGNEFLNVGTAPNETAIPHKVKNKNKNSVIHPNLIPNMLNTSTFLLGEVAFISTCDGVAQSSFKNKLCEIFFKTDDIGFQNDDGNILMKGDTVLLFIPYVELDESVLIATLVYRLTSEETIEMQTNEFRIQDFIVNHFSQRVKQSLCDTWVCNCDISKSLLMGTRLGPNFKNNAAASLKYFKFIQKLHELYQLSDKTCRSLCSLVNQMCAQNIGDTYRKLLAYSPFSLAKSLSWIRHSKDHTLYQFKKKFVNRCKFHAKKHRHPSFVDAHKEDRDNSGSIFFEENNIPTILLKLSTFEEPCSVDDNCNIVNLNTPNNKSFTNCSVSKQSCHESCSSVGSFSSCLDDSAKELSDDVFYSCESDFDSSSTTSQQPHSSSKQFCENDGNSVTAINGINDISSMSTFTNKCSEGLINIEQNGLKEKRCQSYGNTSSYLKLRHFSLFKHRRRNKRKFILPSKNNFCKTCYRPPIETTAEITIINKSYLYFKIENKQQNVTLAFPKCLIPIEMQAKVKLNSVIKITIALHPLINLSQVLYVDFQ